MSSSSSSLLPVIDQPQLNHSKESKSTDEDRRYESRLIEHDKE
jgi:hypothetical protein